VAVTKKETCDGYATGHSGAPLGCV